MTAKRLFVLAALVCAAIYATLTISFGLFVVDWSSPLGIIFFLGFELLFVGTAYDLTEILMSAILKPQDLPRVSSLQSFPPVALVMTVCDDVFPSAIKRLRHQTYPNCDIFILDDSTDKDNRALIDQFEYPVLRRGTRDGFKAGNLNHWLERFGAGYKYLVVFDSDSQADDDFVTRMVQYAEHPDNRNVALFQSRVLPWNTHCVFARIVGTMASARMRVLKRTTDRMGTVFSFGHNYLARIDCILEAGGFPENVTAEDTALTLYFSAAGYSVRLVDVTSYDTEPQNTFLYARRTMRWAKQTVEMFRFPWRHASVRLKLMLCYHLYGYVINSVYLILLLLSAWAFKAEGWTLNEPISYIVATRLYLTPGFIILGGAAILWMVQLSLRAILASATGMSLRDILLHSLLVTPLLYSFVFRLTLEMLRTALGAHVIFHSTNSKEFAFSPLSLKSLLRYMRVPIVYSLLILLGVVLRNHYLLYGPNGLWLLLLLAAPLILWLVQGKASLEIGNAAHCERIKFLTEARNEL